VLPTIVIIFQTPLSPSLPVSYQKDRRNVIIKRKIEVPSPHPALLQASTLLFIFLFGKVSENIKG
jgi:hypothetical protein